MQGPRRSDLVLVAVATAVTGALVLLDGQGWAEWLFGTFLLSGLALLVRLGVDSWRSARSERLRAERLFALRPGVVVERAVARERDRLAVEVDGCIRESLRALADEVAGLEAEDPVPALRRIHALTRRTTSELRRQLGLLRETETETETETEPAGEVTALPEKGRTGARRSATEAAALAALAVVESTAYLLTEGPRAWLPWSVPVTALAAASIAGHRTRPEAAAVAFAAVVCAGSVLDHPVTGGFWIVVALAVLLWPLTSTPVQGWSRGVRRLATVGTALGAVVWSFWRHDPDNLLILVVIATTTLCGGLLVGRQRGRAALARRAAAEREQELDDVTDEAVRAQRVAVARELHDVVSHAVGVVAMQAAAAEMSWPRDPDAVRRAVSVIERTTVQALTDLDRLPPLAGAAADPDWDLLALVDRVRAAGTPVDLTVVGEVRDHADVVHRVVQEALTNALRHAPGSAVSVRVVTRDRHTNVWVVDNGPGARTSAGRRYGLVGLAERVAFAGGSFDSGPGLGGRGFQVHATLPRATVGAPTPAHDVAGTATTLGEHR